MVRLLRAQEGLSEAEDWGEPISLGTATLPADIDLAKLGDLLFQVTELRSSPSSTMRCKQAMMTSAKYLVIA